MPVVERVSQQVGYTTEELNNGLVEVHDERRMEPEFGSGRERVSGFVRTLRADNREHDQDTGARTVTSSASIP